MEGDINMNYSKNKESKEFESGEESQDKSANYTVKTTESVKLKFDKIAEEMNLSKKDLFAKLVDLMGIEVSKNLYDDFSNDIEEFASLTRDLYRCYTHVIERTSSIRKADQKHFSAILENKNQDYSVMNEKIADLKEKLSLTAVIKEDLMIEKNDLTLRLQETQKNLVTVQLLVDEYKEKNDLLLSDLNKLKRFEVENDELKGKINELLINFKEEIAVLEETATTLQKNVDELTAKIELEAKQKPLEIQAAVLEKQEALQIIISGNNEKHQVVINEYLNKLDKLREAQDVKLEKQAQNFDKERKLLEMKLEKQEKSIEAERQSFRQSKFSLEAKLEALEVELKEERAKNRA